MPTVATKKYEGVHGFYEPELKHTFYPGCRACGGSHPLVRKPAMAADVCPDCGEPTQAPGEEVTVGAVIVGWSPAAIVARICFGSARLLSGLIKKV